MESYDFDERGYFWWSDEPIPRNAFAPDNGAYGRLTVSEVGAIHLELDGRLSAERSPLQTLANVGRSVKRNISGILRNSNHSVLLSHIRGDGGKISTNGLSHEQYTADLCLVSASTFANPAELPLTQCLTMSMSGFEKWLRLGSIKGKRSKSGLTLKHKLPKSHRYTLDDGTVKIDYDLAGPYRNEFQTDELHLTDKASVTYRFRRPAPIESSLERYRWFNDLLTLLTNVERTLDWPTIRISQNSTKTATVYFPRGRRLTKEVQWQDCWTSFPGLKEQFGDILTNWNKKRDLIGPGFYLYLGTRRGMDLYAEHKLVSLAFGLESFHRTLNPDTPDRKLDEKIEGIVSQVASTKDKKWLRSRLKNLGGPNLQQRIIEMLKQLPLELKEDRLHDFAERCARLRNDISHHGRIQGPGAYERHLEEMLYMNTALDHLYHARILSEIGVSASVIHGVFNGSQHSFGIRYMLWKVGLLDAEPGFEQQAEYDD